MVSHTVWSWSQICLSVSPLSQCLLCLRHFVRKASHVCSFCPQRGRQWCAPVHFFTVLRLHLAKRCSFSTLDSEGRKNEAVMENYRNEKGTGHAKRISHDTKKKVLLVVPHSKEISWPKFLSINTFIENILLINKSLFEFKYRFVWFRSYILHLCI